MMVAQPSEGGPGAVLQLGLGQCKWQPGSPGHTLPCSWHILEAGTRVSGRAGVTGRRRTLGAASTDGSSDTDGTQRMGRRYNSGKGPGGGAGYNIRGRKCPCSVC